ncbi:16S rRNA (guanine(527)-N(7))-methyltransferase RsmG [Roseibaca sp. Y0-43]|uniref:16S rRNA (guanine(527)-N(7))-methyltransferase RsmG n=1 Tax=Roseibaca sp. Y0-43 TaxID=2816854 RepID=UPI001D0C7060|nr:16S rRNA (guanine(527)-N(7))-methyltransferase RsmG [Roseibaca sp. Y0-43]MCC1480957.1 16S rRNA (guanine(527)-N(7))-methyltransferase RsmG [Roseibaca sp. Y0-43]
MTERITVLDVSRETFESLQKFESLLRKWNPRINLVSPSTLADLWERHILDSAQVFALREQPVRHWVDLGSGGGLPGVVCAVLAKELAPDARFTLVESDKRKAAFLAVCKQELGLNMTVQPVRAEALTPANADTVSARALAPLAQLLPMVARHLHPEGVALLPKGKSYEAELEAARAEWQFDLAVHPSMTDASARILALKEIKRV